MTSSHRCYVDPLRLEPAADCYCGSGMAFSRCCGRDEPGRPPPHGIVVVPDFVTAAERNRLLRFAQKQQRKWLTMVDVEKSTSTRNVQKRDPGRVTQAVDMGKRAADLNSLMRRALTEQVAPALKVRPDTFEPPYILRYPPGGKYVSHTDGEQFDEAARRWYRLVDRDVSLLVYLNDSYEGGQLHFDHLNFTYQPRAGELVFFPSNHRYNHQSLPIESGIKWAVVCWAAMAHTPRVSTGQKNWVTLPV